MANPSVIVRSLTGFDNETPIIAKVGAALAVPIYIGMGIYDVCMNHHIDYLSFGSGFGALIAGVGVAIKFESGKQPEGPNEPH